MKRCRGPCGRVLPDQSFAKTGRGGKYGRNVCHRCMASQRSEPYKQRKAARQVRYKRLLRESRPASCICTDSRHSDQKHGRVGHDLGVEFIEQLISSGCIYCGETTLRMTLDRKDNDRAHTKDNVVPACIRCNYARGNMPYEAWLFLTPRDESCTRSRGFRSLDR